MDAKHKALKRLVNGTLPLERVGPHLRHSLRRALLSGQTDRIRLVARVVVAELLRRGDLLRIAVEGDESGSGPYCLIKGTTQLVDLAPLGGDVLQLPRSQRRAADPPPASTAPTLRVEPGDYDDFSGVLVAMEQAQDLEIGTPLAGDKEAILDSILQLLSGFLPQFDLFVLVDNAERIPLQQSGVFSCDPLEPANLWLKARDPGSTIWFPTPNELPKRILAHERDREDQMARREGRLYSCGVAVPLWSPDHMDGIAAEPTEEGLFFLVAHEPWQQQELLNLAERLSRFVTRRWQHQRDVNLRIHRDSLTGVYNRGFFDTQFTLELERARRSNLPLTLIIADLDHFKNINDSLGHQVGDQVLHMVARRLQEELRRIDHICRIGGEEFALILPDTNLDAGREVMNRLLSVPFTEEVVHDGEVIRLNVTSSFGAVTFPDAGADAFELYRKADAMLYLSKDLGRNQCHIWSSEGDHIQLKPGRAARG